MSSMTTVPISDAELDQILSRLSGYLEGADADALVANSYALLLQAQAAAFRGATSSRDAAQTTLNAARAALLEADGQMDAALLRVAALSRLDLSKEAQAELFAGTAGRSASQVAQLPIVEELRLVEGLLSRLAARPDWGLDATALRDARGATAERYTDYDRARAELSAAHAALAEAREALVLAWGRFVRVTQAMVDEEEQRRFISRFPVRRTRGEGEVEGTPSPG